MRKIIGFFLFLMLIGIACEKEDDEHLLENVEADLNYTISDHTSTDDALHNLAHLFVRISQDKMFTDEMLTLSANLSSTQKSASVTETVQRMNMSELSKIIPIHTGNARGTFNWQELVESHPTIDVEVPDFKDFPRKDWSFEKVKKVVVVDSKTKGRENVDYYEAYDIETGRREKIAAEVPPDEWVMILKESDHKIAVHRSSGKTIGGNRFKDLEIDPSKFLYSSGKYDVYTIVDVFLIFDENAQIADDGANHARSCLRDLRSSTDYISKVRAVSYYGLSQWAETDVVLKVDYGWIEFSPPSTWTARKANKVFYAQKIDFGHNGSVWDHYVAPSGVGVYTINWDNSEISSKIIYDWMEVDEPDVEITVSNTIPSGTVKVTDSDGNEITVSGPSKTVTKKTTPKNDPLGSAIVEYCDYSAWPGHQYNTGSLYFWVGD